MAHSAESLETLSAEVDKLVEAEQSRRQSVDSRLTTIIGLMSIAATVVISGLLALATGAAVPENTWVRVLTAVILVYLAFQLLVALWNAVRGVTRHATSAVSVQEIIPDPGVPGSQVNRERMIVKAELLEERIASTDEKISRLAVAHRAILNFIVVLFLLAVLAAFVAATRTPPPTPAACCSTVPPPAQPVIAGSAIRLVAIIGPFRSGEHELDKTSTRRCLQRALSHLQGSAPSGWLIVGRVDRRALLPARIRLYGSNQALAMVRANWVYAKVLPGIQGFEPTQAAVVVGGARSIGPEGGDIALEQDRAVDLYVLSSPQPTPALPQPRPVICPSE